MCAILRHQLAEHYVSRVTQKHVILIHSLEVKDVYKGNKSAVAVITFHDHVVYLVSVFYLHSSIRSTSAVAR